MSLEQPVTQNTQQLRKHFNAALKHPTQHNRKTQDQSYKQRITQNLVSLKTIITHYRYHIYHLFNFKGAQVNFIAITTSDVLKFNS